MSEPSLYSKSTRNKYERDCWQYYFDLYAIDINSNIETCAADLDAATILYYSVGDFPYAPRAFSFFDSTARTGIR